MNTRTIRRARNRLLQGCSLCALSLSLAACSDPLDRVDLLQDVTLSESSGEGVAALPADDASNARDLGLFARLLGRDQTPDIAADAPPETAEDSDATPELVVEAENSGKVTPKRGLFGFLKPRAPVPQPETAETRSDSEAPEVQIASLDVSEDVAPEEEVKPRRALFGFLKPKSSASKVGEEDDTGQASEVLAEAKEGEAGNPSETLVAEAEETKDKKGLLAWLRQEKGAPVAQTASEETLPTVQTASLSPTLGASRKDTPALFSLFRSKPKDAPKPVGIPFGTRIAFGKAAPLCDYPKGQLGALVAQYPEDKPVYRLYDSQPGEKAAHAFYIKGFADGCLRQVTASVAVFGSVEMHEQLRYGLPADLHPYSDTDKAYEQLKRKVCGVGKKAPCGEKLPLLAPNTVFLSLYDSYGNSQDWANLLLHDGQIMAKDLKSGDL